jgi:hypothetical protein
MPVRKDIFSAVKKSLQKFDFTRLEEKCANEAQTRMCLIEPLLEMLGYSRSDDMLTEITAGWGKKNAKADLGLLVKGKVPEIIIECKKFGRKLTDKEAAQLNGYFTSTKGSKLGILTNGMEWLFYTDNLSTKETSLYSVPFLRLDFTEINDTLIEDFARFHKNDPQLKEIHENAQEFFFLQGFSDALYAELSDPTEPFIRALFNRMEGKALTDTLKKKIKELITSKSIQEVLPRVMEDEAKRGTMVITTAEELKIYHAVKTILLHKFKKIDSSRITYRDQKNSFNIIIDGNNHKLVAKITSSKNKYYLDINLDMNSDKFEIDGLDSIVSLKKKIEDAAAQFLI